MYSNTLKKLTLCFATIILTAFAARIACAQNASDITLNGTEWRTDPVIVPAANIDNSITQVVRQYAFRAQGIVRLTVVRTKSAGVQYKIVYDYVYVGGTRTSYEYRYVWKAVLTPPYSQSEQLTGTYEVNANSIRLSFPEFTIAAKVSEDSMDGLLTHKTANKREKWMVRRVPTQKPSPAPEVVLPPLYDPTPEFFQLQNSICAAVLTRQGILTITFSNKPDRIINLDQVKQIALAADSSLYDPTPEASGRENLCYALEHRKGKLELKMRNGSTQKIDLSEAKDISIKP